MWIQLFPAPRAGEKCSWEGKWAGGNEEGESKDHYDNDLRIQSHLSLAWDAWPPLSPSPIYGFMSPWGIYEKLNDSQSAAEE